MSHTGPYQNQNNTPPFYLGSVNLPPAAFSGVRSRRIIAFCLDFILVSVLVAVISSILMFVTLGLSLLFLPPMWPIVAFFYNGLTVSGARMATPGMRAMDLEIRTIEGYRTPFFLAAVHAVLLYLSLTFPLVFIVSLISSDKRCLHDMLSGLIVVRRPR